IGREASADIVEEVRAATRSQQVRVIHPGQAATIDYRHDRVNIHVHERRAITSVTCATRGIMPRNPLAFALLALPASACAREPGPDTADTADTPPAADAAEPPLEARMAVEPPPRRMPGSDEAVEQCDADAARGVIGQAATAEVVEQARQAAGAELVR